jgi:hypothetical protein
VNKPSSTADSKAREPRKAKPICRRALAYHLREQVVEAFARREAGHGLAQRLLQRFMQIFVPIDMRSGTLRGRGALPGRASLDSPARIEAHDARNPRSAGGQR